MRERARAGSARLSLSSARERERERGELSGARRLTSPWRAAARPTRGSTSIRSRAALRGSASQDMGPTSSGTARRGFDRARARGLVNRHEAAAINRPSAVEGTNSHRGRRRRTTTSPSYGRGGLCFQPRAPWDSGRGARARAPRACATRSRWRCAAARRGSVARARARSGSFRSPVQGVSARGPPAATRAAARRARETMPSDGTRPRRPRGRIDEARCAAGAPRGSRRRSGKADVSSRTARGALSRLDETASSGAARRRSRNAPRRVARDMVIDEPRRSSAAREPARRGGSCPAIGRPKRAASVCTQTALPTPRASSLHTCDRRARMARTAGARARVEAGPHPRLRPPAASRRMARVATIPLARRAHRADLRTVSTSRAAPSARGVAGARRCIALRAFRRRRPCFATASEPRARARLATARGCELLDAAGRRRALASRRRRARGLGEVEPRAVDVDAVERGQPRSRAVGALRARRARATGAGLASRLVCERRRPRSR